MNLNFLPLFNNHLRLITLTILFLFFVSFHSWSQERDIYAHGSLAEKIYLQLDRKIYTTNETIWFKSIVTNTVYHGLTTLSGVLYVELIGPNEKIVEKKIIKIEHGIGSGFFELNKNYNEGTYLIRAYTQWNKNFESDFIFEEYIQIFSFSDKEKIDPINNIVLEQKEHNKHWLRANLDPFVLDSLHENKLTLFIILDNKKDSLSIKKNENDRYEINFPIPDEHQIVTLKIQTKNKKTYSKTISINEDFLDLQFFPESGELVYGISSKVGYKALNAKGKGVEVAGKIVNEQGKDITLFRSNQLGIGSFVLSKVDSNALYFAKLTSKTDKGMSLMYPLPKISRLGNVLSINNKRDKVHIKASSNYLKNDSIYLRVSCRGLDYYEIKGRLKQGVLNLSLATNKLPEGIIAFTMMDGANHPLAERLYFNEKPEGRINIKISSDKDIYEQREHVRLHIETNDNHGNAIKSNLSLLVLNKNQLGEMQHKRQNILSYFLLNSDLRGKIESPGFYFNNSKNENKDIDDLLLTQGWRKYHYTKPLDTILFQPENELNITGSVDGSIFQKKKKTVALTLLAFGNPKIFETQITDSLGRFNFNINDSYGKELDILIQSANKSGKKKNYSISLDKMESPTVEFDHIKSIEKIDSVQYALVEKSKERKWVDDAFQLSTDVNELDEVVLKVYKMTPERIKVIKNYGEADKVITGKAILANEEKWSYGLYSVLMFNFPDQIEIMNVGQDLYARVFDAIGITLVVVDGIPVLEEDYPLIPYIPPSEISSFEIIKGANNFMNLFATVFPSADWKELSENTQGNVIAIYTKSGKGLYATRKSVGIISASVPIFSPIKEFYAPKYNNITPDDWIKPDLRALVHWEPNLVVDTLGNVTTTFYNADNTGEMLIVVEAISDEGAIGYKEFVYEVKKKDNYTN